MIGSVLTVSTYQGLNNITRFFVGGSLHVGRAVSDDPIVLSF